MIAATLLLVAGTSIVIKQVKGIQEGNYRIKLTNDNLEIIRNSLVNFVAVNGRLPCPASGAAVDNGLSVPATAAANCTNPNGTVPWVTLGIAQSVSVDGWARKISYRVYQGNTGMTQAGGADMTDCHIAPPAPVIPAVPNRLCTAAHTTSGNPLSPIGFFGQVAGIPYRPGFTVNDMATAVSQVGFVLISHGESGYGAWISGGGRVTLPPAANLPEFRNTQVAPPSFYRQPYSDKTILITANNHFDDEVVYMTIPDIARQARRGPRNWELVAGPIPPVAGAMATISLDNATFALSGGGVIFIGQSSGVSLITLITSVLVPSPLVISTGTGYVVARNAARTAIGVCAAAPAVCDDTTALLAAPEYLSFLLTSVTAQKVSFGVLNFGAGESLQVTFRNSGVTIGTPIPVSFPTLPINLMPTVPSAAFDEVIVTPQGTSDFFIQSVKFCDAITVCWP